MNLLQIVEEVEAASDDGDTVRYFDLMEEHGETLLIELKKRLEWEASFFNPVMLRCIKKRNAFRNGLNMICFILKGKEHFQYDVEVVSSMGRNVSVNFMREVILTPAMLEMVNQMGDSPLSPPGETL